MNWCFCPWRLKINKVY